MATPPQNSEAIRKMNAAHIEKIKVQLGAISRAFKGIQKSGIDRRILVAYLHDVTKIGKQDVEYLLNAQEDFYAKLSKLAE